MVIIGYRQFCVHISLAVNSVHECCPSIGADPTKDNDMGHRPEVYVRNPRVKEALKDSAIKVIVLCYNSFVLLLVCSVAKKMKRM